MVCLACGCRGLADHRGEQQKEVVRRFLEEVMNTGDVQRLPDFVSPDYVEVYRNRTHALGLRGAERHVLGVRAAFPDLQITVEQQISQGDWVATRITARGTHRGPWLGMAPTGKTLEFGGVNLDRIEDGLIVEHVGAANLFAPLLEAGAIRVVGSQTGRPTERVPAGRTEDGLSGAPRPADGAERPRDES